MNVSLNAIQYETGGEDVRLYIGYMRKCYIL